MNLFKKFLLVLCIAISAQPAYGWGWNGINFGSVASTVSSYLSPILKTASENKVAAVGLGLAVLGVLAFSKYTYGKSSEKPDQHITLKSNTITTDIYGNPTIELSPKQKVGQKTDSSPVFLNEDEDEDTFEMPEGLEELPEGLEPIVNKPNFQNFQKLQEPQQQVQQSDESSNEELDPDDLNIKLFVNDDIQNNDNPEDPHEDFYRSYRVSTNSTVKNDENDDNNEEPLVKIVSELNSDNLDASYRTPDSLKKEKEKKENEDLLGFEEDVIPVDDFIVVKNEEHVDDQPIAKYLNQTFHKKCPSMSELAKLITGIKDYCDLIKPGANLAWDLLAGTFDYNTVGGARVYNLDNNNRKALEHKRRNEYLGDIVSLCWFMYSLALHKDKIFEEGSFIVHDNGKIFNYLLNYVNKVNPKENKHPVHHSESPYGCCRASSHLIKWQKQGNKHFGIDIRFGTTPKTSRSNILPTGKSHILFGKLDNERTFIKMEENGVYKYDGLGAHAWNFIVAQGRKTPVVNWFTGTDDAPTFCKERIPLEIVSDAQAVGIAKIDAIDDIVQIYKKDTTGKYDKLMEKIIKLYPHDFEGRIGNEVILDPSDLEWSYFYHPKVTQDDKNAIKSIVRIKYLMKWYADTEGRNTRAAKEIQNRVKSFESSAKLPALNKFVQTNNIIKQIMTESPYTTRNIVFGKVSQNLHI